MNITAHLAAARRHLAAVDRLTRAKSKKPTPSQPPEDPEELATPEEIAACFAQIRAMLAAE